MPRESKKVGSCQDELNKDLAEFKDAHRTDMACYNKRARELYGRLRETWENFVEEILFNKTIMRFGNAVKTQSLKEVSVGTNDAVTIYLAMKNCSDWMHSRVKALDHDLPAPDEIRKNIDQLNNFKTAVKNRQKLAKVEYDQRLRTQSSNIG